MPYYCDKCNDKKTFGHRETVRLHVKKVHGIGKIERKDGVKLPSTLIGTYHYEVG